MLMWFRRMMEGRYGMDQLTVGMLVLFLILQLLLGLTGWRWIGLLELIVTLLCLLRFFSRDIERRRRENQVFLTLLAPVREWSVRKLMAAQDSRTHRHFKCPGCKQKIRVPKGRGKICITCPSCRREFIKRT